MAWIRAMGGGMPKKQKLYDNYKWVTSHGDTSSTVTTVNDSANKVTFDATKFNRVKVTMSYTHVQNNDWEGNKGYIGVVLGGSTKQIFSHTGGVRTHSGTTEVTYNISDLSGQIAIYPYCSTAGAGGTMTVTLSATAEV